MRLSLQVHYAICGLFDLAYNGQGGPVQVRVIGPRQGVPTRYLEQIFQRLRKAGLVRGKRGPGGGYQLARPAREISLRHIVEAVEGSLHEGVPPEELAASGEGAYRPDFLWPELADRLAALLEETTLEGLCHQAARAAVPRSSADSYIYEI